MCLLVLPSCSLKCNYFNAVRQEKNTKGIQIRKEKIKLSSFSDDIIVYVENLKQSTKQQQLLELRSHYKVAGYDVNIQKSITYLYTSNKNLKLKHNAIYIITKN